MADDLSKTPIGDALLLLARKSCDDHLAKPLIGFADLARKVQEMELFIAAGAGPKGTSEFMSLAPPQALVLKADPTRPICGRVIAAYDQFGRFHSYFFCFKTAGHTDGGCGITVVEEMFAAFDDIEDEEEIDEIPGVESG